ncbi:MAG TPA: antitoxin MazE-like protein, partial [Candidatus Competibacteraceae bacterium]|nr:antitoxin MazE-like protein [Candidatus Competibacteraceae bacterium]
MSTPNSHQEAIRRYRERMRAKGFRAIQLWVPDTRSPE